MPCRMGWNGLGCFTEGSVSGLLFRPLQRSSTLSTIMYSFVKMVPRAVDFCSASSRRGPEANRAIRPAAQRQRRVVLSILRHPLEDAEQKSTARGTILTKEYIIVESVEDR